MGYNSDSFKQEFPFIRIAHINDSINRTDCFCFWSGGSGSLRNYQESRINQLEGKYQKVCKIYQEIIVISNVFFMSECLHISTVL